MEQCERPNYIFRNSKKEKWQFVTHKKYTREMSEYANVMEIPCGYCKSCLKNKSLQFKNRLLLEKKNTCTSYFFTLTYDQYHLKDNSTHIIHLRKFMKKLKDYYLRNFGIKNIRYFGVSEYGDKSLRPHYHVIIFNIPIFECDFTRATKTPKNLNIGHTHWINETYFTNTKLREMWKKGQITISFLNENRINYIVNYLFKEFNGLTSKQRKEFLKLGFELPKKIQSTNLGLKEILKHKEEFLKDNFIYMNGKELHANKYIDTKAGILSDERTEQRLFARFNKVSLNRKRKMTINNKKGTI